jgi:hypothetical protein
MKVYQTPVGMLFIVAAFLTNCISCVRRRNKATKNFKCVLSTLEIYLADLLAPSGATVDENPNISDDELYTLDNDDSDISMDDSSAIDSENESGDSIMSESLNFIQVLQSPRTNVKPWFMNGSGCFLIDRYTKRRAT